MPLLLDTHIWLWAVAAPDRLAGPVRNALGSLTEPPRLSPISPWEAMMLAERGRIHLEPGPRRWIRRALQALPVREVPLTLEVAIASRIVRLEHQDPADRFLAATAKVFGLKLVTADAHLLRCPDIEVLPNR